MEPHDREQWEEEVRLLYLFLAEAVRRGLLKTIYRDGVARLDNVPWSLWGTFQADLETRLRPILTKVYSEHAGGVLRDLPITFSFDLVNERARDWAKDYTFDLVRGITDTERRLLQDTISRYYQEGMTLGEVRKLIEQSPAFSAVRADMIATTEITRASVQGELWAVAEVEKAGVLMESVWNTNADEMVCPICGPRNQQVRGNGWTEPPPAHPRCRCWLNHTHRTIGELKDG